MTRIMAAPDGLAASPASPCRARRWADGAARATGVSGSAASSIARRRAAALCSVSSNSRSGTEPATMPAPRVDVGLAVAQDRAPDRDRRVEIAVVAEVADRAAVQAAPLALGGGDQLHRPDLRARPTACPAGKTARSASRASSSGLSRASTWLTRDGGRGCSARPPCTWSRRPCPAGRPGRGRCGRGRRASRARPVPSGRAGAARRAASSSAGVGAARPGAGDRVGRQSVALDLEQELRARADDLERRRPDEEQVRARVDPAQGPIERDPVERPAVAGRPAARRTGAGRGRPGSPRRRRSRPWRPRPRGCTRPGRGSSGRPRSPSGRRGCTWLARRRGSDRRDRRRPSRARPPTGGRPLEGLEDRPLGDPVATFEVGRLGVERGDRRQRVGQVVEDEDEVGLDERRGRHADRIGVGQRHGRLERA